MKFYPVVILLIIVAVLSGCGGLAGDVPIVSTLPALTPIPVQAPSNPPDIAHGQQIFEMNCTRCHGENGAGGGELVESGQVPRMPSFLEASHVREQSPADYYSIITNGNLINLMPPWSDSLSVQDRWDVAMYVYTLHYTPELLARGDALNGTPDPTFQLASDRDLATASGLTGEDAFALVADQRLNTIVNYGVAPEPLSTEAVSALESVTFTGTVTQGTADGIIPADLLVTLRFGNAEDGIQVLESTLDAEGRFRFDNVPYSPTYQYFAVAVYQERGFVSDLLNASTIQPENDLSITLYETTQDASQITLTDVDLLIEVLNVEGLGTGLVLTQRNSYTNASDRMFYITPQGQEFSVSLLMQLPAGSIILTSQDSARYIVAQEQYAVIDTLPVYPGLHLNEVQYFIPYEDGALIDIPMNNRTDALVDIFLVEQGDLTINSDIFQFVANEDLGTAQEPFPTKHYSGSIQLEVGESITFDVNGLLFGSSTTSTGAGIITIEQLIPIALIGIALIVVVVGVIIFFTRRNASQASEMDQLLKELAELEVLHEAGRINHDVYQTRRQSLKEKVAQLMVNQTKETDG